MTSKQPGRLSSDLLWPTLLAAIGFTVLMALGTWQLQRKAWKEDLIRQLAARTKAEPVALDAFLVAPHRGTESFEYVRVRAKGRFVHEREIHLHAVDRGGSAGWHVVTPLLTPAGAVVLVNRGFVPDRLKERDQRPGSLIEGEVELNGLVRGLAGRKAMFVPANDPIRNQWYWLDHAAVLERTRGLGKPPALLVIEAERVHVPVPPAGGVTRLDLSNRHLEYALTWYGIALTLIGVYGAYAIAHMRAHSRQRVT